jgi:RNA polymerase sigma-70 factor (ECF subfamily)
MPRPAEDSSGWKSRARFATTQWSVVLAAGRSGGPDASTALAQLCEVYWYPLYAYVRRRVPSVHEAQDLTQAFFSHLLEKHAIAAAQPERGRFRAFLLTSLKHFLANEWNKARTRKRGGGRNTLSLDFDSGESRFHIEPADDLTPERLYQRRWVMTLLDCVLDRLRTEFIASGKGEHFERLKGVMTGGGNAADYQRAAEALGITPAAAKQAAYRLRKRYRELLREEVARTVADDGDVDDEIRQLFASLE